MAPSAGVGGNAEVTRRTHETSGKMIWPLGLKPFVPGMSGNKLPVFGNKLHQLVFLASICSSS